MKSILYIQFGVNQISEIEMYQIYLNLYKQSTSEKELVIFNIKQDDDHYVFSKIFRKTKSETDDILDIHREDIYLNDEETIEEVIDKYIIKLQKKYEVCILLTSLKQSRLLGKYIDQIITLKKSDLVFPM